MIPLLLYLALPSTSNESMSGTSHTAGFFIDGGARFLFEKGDEYII